MLAVYHGIAFHTVERFLDFNLIVANDFAVATVEGDRTVIYFRDHPKPSYLSSKTHPQSSKGPSVSVASIG
jgi:hypothetical protein